MPQRTKILDNCERPFDVPHCPPCSQYLMLQLLLLCASFRNHARGAVAIIAVISRCHGPHRDT